MACHPKQRAYVLDPSPRFAALTSRGGGKTTAAAVRLLKKGVKIPRARLLFIAQTKDQAEELIWERLKAIVERCGIRASWNETKLRCTITTTGATIRLVGADDKKEIDKLRGRPFHEVIVDEAASYRPQLLSNLIHRVIGPRLGDYGGVLGFQGTPGHVLAGLFYDVTRSNSDIGCPWERRDDPDFVDRGWSVHHWTLLDGVAAGVPAQVKLWAEALREKARNKWTDENPIWRREYLAIWAADDAERMYKFTPHLESGARWNLWNPERDQKTGFAIMPPGAWHWAYGFDFGHGMPFAMNVLAWEPSDARRVIRQVFEYNRRGMYAKKIAELIIGEAKASSPFEKDIPYGGCIGVTGWPDILVGDFAGMEGLGKELSEVYGITVKPAEKKHKYAAVELMNGDLIEGRFLALERGWPNTETAGVLATQMAELQWRIDEWGVLKEPKSGDDQCDGAIYPRREIAAWFDERAPKDAPPVFPELPALAVDSTQEENVVDDYSSILSDGYYDESADF